MFPDRFSPGSSSWKYFPHRNTLRGVGRSGHARQVGCIILGRRFQRPVTDLTPEQFARLKKAREEPTGTMIAPPKPGPRPAPPAEPSAFRQGETVLDRFQIVRVLGCGGMGEVYEAQDRELGPVALKTIRQDHSGDGTALR